MKEKIEKVIKVSTGTRKEIERLSVELEDLKRYHALSDRILKCPEVGVAPDELISSLRRKGY